MALISRAAVGEFLDRKLDNFLWVKKLAREDILRELSHLRVKPKFKTEPWIHQLVCFYIMRAYPRFLLLLDMGAGKTKIVADLITQIQREGKLDRALVTVPRLSNIDDWNDNLAKHSDLEPTLINVEDIEEKWERLLKARGDVSVIDLAGLQWALCKKEKKGKGYKLVRDDKRVRELLRRYNFLGIDEIHKLSNHDNLRHGFMNQLSKEMEYVYGATGTLFGKSVESMWTPFYLVDRGETLGETLGLFRSAFFDAKPKPFGGTLYTLNKDMKDDLHRVIQHRSIRYEDYEMHDLPKKVPRTINLVMGDEQREHYLRALEGLINAGGNTRELEGAWIKMRQIVSGYLSWKDSHGSHVLHFKRNPKLEALETLVEGMGDSKIIVVYWFTETGRMIVEHLKKLGMGVEWLYGGTKDRTALRRRFLDPKSASNVLVMQAEAGGTGTDGLQEVSRYGIMYETPTDPITRKQTEKRIGRPGQTKRWYIYDLVMRGSSDKGILESLQDGIDVHQAVVNGKRQVKSFFLGD